MNRDWFTKGKYGLFIHFGLYSVAARHEWVQTLEEISAEEYDKYFENFNPDLFSAADLAEKVEKLGFKYVILTVKHHEGFCLWDTNETDYKITKTQYQKDLLSEFVTEFRKRDIKIGLYYSLLDWHEETFPIDGYHPMRNSQEFRLKKGDIGKYQVFMKKQITELLTNYGSIDYLWFDFSYKSRDWGYSKGKGADEWDSLGLEKVIRSLQPNILINDRLDLGTGVKTPEQFTRSSGMDDYIWETVQTLNNSWGYDRDNKNFKSSEMVLKQLIDTVAKGGNFVINVGPTARGEVDRISEGILTKVGAWLKRNQISIFNTTASAYIPPVDCRYTQNGNKLYLHVFSWPYRTILLPGLGDKVKFARLLNDGSEIRFVNSNQIGGERETTDNLYKEITEVHIKESLDPSSLVLNIPIEQPDELVTVIELTLREDNT